MDDGSSFGRSRRNHMMATFRFLLLSGTLLLFNGAVAQTPPEAVPPPEESATQESAAAVMPPPEDSTAITFMMKCMGCHTLGGGALTGPDLKNSQSYPRQTVWDATKRMEKNVGPMSDEEVAALTDFLLSPDAGARIEAQRALVSLREAATLEPGNAVKGKALFGGHTAFLNGGVACAACHQAGGQGGNLAASLEDAYTRLGELPLMATVESPGFPVMRAIYTVHPVEKQESVHLVKYLETVAEDPLPPSTMPLHAIGGVGALAVLLLLGKATNRRVAGTRRRMVTSATRRKGRDMQPRSEVQ